MAFANRICQKEMPSSGVFFSDALSRHAEFFSLVDAGVRDALKRSREASTYVCCRCFSVAYCKRCARCGFAYYCSERCQREDWAAHKRYCARPQLIVQKLLDGVRALGEDQLGALRDACATCVGAPTKRPREEGEEEPEEEEPKAKKRKRLPPEVEEVEMCADAAAAHMQNMSVTLDKALEQGLIVPTDERGDPLPSPLDYDAPDEPRYYQLQDQFDRLPRKDVLVGEKKKSALPDVTKIISDATDVVPRWKGTSWGTSIARAVRAVFDFLGGVASAAWTGLTSVCAYLKGLYSGSVVQTTYEWAWETAGAILGKVRWAVVDWFWKGINSLVSESVEILLKTLDWAKDLPRGGEAIAGAEAGQTTTRERLLRDYVAPIVKLIGAPVTAMLLLPQMLVMSSSAVIKDTLLTIYDGVVALLRKGASVIQTALRWTGLPTFMSWLSGTPVIRWLVEKERPPPAAESEKARPPVAESSSSGLAAYLSERMSKLADKISSGVVTGVMFVTKKLFSWFTRFFGTNQPTSQEMTPLETEILAGAKELLAGLVNVSPSERDKLQQLISAAETLPKEPALPPIPPSIRDESFTRLTVEKYMAAASSGGDAMATFVIVALTDDPRAAVEYASGGEAALDVVVRFGFPPEIFGADFSGMVRHRCRKEFKDLRDYCAVILTTELPKADVEMKEAPPVGIEMGTFVSVGTWFLLSFMWTLTTLALLAGLYWHDVFSKSATGPQLRAQRHEYLLTRSRFGTLCQKWRDQAGNEGLKALGMTDYDIEHFETSVGTAWLRYNKVAKDFATLEKGTAFVNLNELARPFEYYDLSGADSGRFMTRELTKKFVDIMNDAAGDVTKIRNVLALYCYYKDNGISDSGAKVTNLTFEEVEALTDPNRAREYLGTLGSKPGDVAVGSYPFANIVKSGVFGSKAPNEIFGSPNDVRAFNAVASHVVNLPNAPKAVKAAVYGIYGTDPRAYEESLALLTSAYENNQDYIYSEMPTQLSTIATETKVRLDPEGRPIGEERAAKQPLPSYMYNPEFRNVDTFEFRKMLDCATGMWSVIGLRALAMLLNWAYVSVAIFGFGWVYVVAAIVLVLLDVLINLAVKAARGTLTTADVLPTIGWSIVRVGTALFASTGILLAIHWIVDLVVSISQSIAEQFRENPFKAVAGFGMFTIAAAYVMTFVLPYAASAVASWGIARRMSKMLGRTREAERLPSGRETLEYVRQQRAKYGY